MLTSEQVRVAVAGIKTDPETIGPIARAIEAEASGPLLAQIEHLKQEAQIHAQEARTANATIAEIYQVCSGGTGEPGNWNGAEPVRARIAELESQLAETAKDAALLHVVSTEYGPWVKSNLHEGETYCRRCYLRSCFLGQRACDPHVVPAPKVGQDPLNQKD